MVEIDPVCSSSARLYGFPESGPIPARFQIKPIDPFGPSKATDEWMIKGLASSASSWRFGRDPNREPYSLRRFVNQMAIGRREQVGAFGDDWPAPDVSCRSYSVLEVTQACQSTCSVSNPDAFVARRPGDAATAWADPILALKMLHWRIHLAMTSMCKDGWAQANANQQGYGTVL